MLTTLRMESFRSHTSSDFTFRTEGVVIAWRNGSGKTNILEAIYCAINARTWDGRSPSFSLQDGKNEFSILVDADGRRYILFLQKGKTNFSCSVDKKKVTKPAYIKNMPYVANFFSNQELNIVYLDPTLRRSFLDEHLSLAFLGFDALKSEYQNLLRQRNKLLILIQDKKAAPSDLDFWDTKIVERIEQYRKYRLQICGYFQERKEWISEFLEKDIGLALEYVSRIPSVDRVSEWCLDYLRTNRERDILIGRTMIGPHLDDLGVYAGPQKEQIALRLSRGECKTLFLALKILGSRFVQEHQPEKKQIYLLDDLFSELDIGRCQKVMDVLRDSQMFITTQDTISADLWKERQIIHI